MDRMTSMCWTDGWLLGDAEITGGRASVGGQPPPRTNEVRAAVPVPADPVVLP
jgi:hypothetical protein